MPVKLIGIALTVWFTLAWTGTASGETATLVREGEPTAVIVLPDEPDTGERQAADELVEHIELMSGATLAVMSVSEANHDADDAHVPIRIGGAADAGLEELIRERSDNPWSFALVVTEESIELRGLSPEGTRTAAYELLEQLGVRWFIPGDIGRVVPERATVYLDWQQTVQVPSFDSRRQARNHASTWNDRNRLGGVGGTYGSHSIQPFSPSRTRREMFEDNPEYFRMDADGERRVGQLCLTNSTDNIEENEVLRLAVEYYREQLRENPDTRILNMGPNDGGGYCQCDYCRELDPPDYVTSPLATPEPSYTDRYVWFFNRMLDELEDEFPDVRIGFYAYAQHILPPHEGEHNDRLVVSVAPIHACRIHGPNNPMCPESNYYTWLLQEWQPYVHAVADRGYLFNLACPGFPFPMMHRLREEIPLAYENRVDRYLPSASDAWATHNPSMYLAAKLTWDHTADVDEILADFYEKYYGPAEGPMAAYHTLMDETIRDADHHTGSSWDMPLIYPAHVRSEARAHLEGAATLAADHDDEAYATRVEITRKGLDFLDAFCDLLAHRNNHDFVAEKAAFDELVAIRDSLLEDYEIPMLYDRHANRLLDRFIARMTDANYATTQGGSQIVAKFDPQWKFQQDPERWGHYIGLHKPESQGGNWQTIRTDITWSNQGLRYYFGQAWYRQSVEVPADFEGETIHIWFAGVDNTAEIWVNGQFVGANHDGAEFDLDAYGSAFRAFEFDATDAINFGEPNVVTVRTYRPRTNELGTGGLVGPSMFYVPGTE